MKIDLGCGANKAKGFVGFDRFPLPGVDVVCDLNAGIPLADDSVDKIVASHSLEHLNDLSAIMREMYRVCQDRATISIVAPYHATALNIANPYHKQAFNEHTARFFTRAEESLVDRKEYKFPFADVWGLAASDHSDWRADIRCLSLEFFYMPAYRHLDDDLKRILRKSLFDVCDQVLIHLLVVKSPIERNEIERFVSNLPGDPTENLKERRKAENESNAGNALTDLLKLPRRLTEIQANLELLSARLKSEIEALSPNALQEWSKAQNEAMQQVGNAIDLQARRITAVNAELTRRYRVLAEKVDETPAVESEEIRQIYAHIVDGMISRERTAVLPLRYLRRYYVRASSHTERVRRAFPTLVQEVVFDETVAAGFQIQSGELWRKGERRSFPLAPQYLFAGLEFVLDAEFVPNAEVEVFTLQICDLSSGESLAAAPVLVDRTIRSLPVRVNFPAVNGARVPLTAVFAALPSAETFGVRLYEWRKLSMFRRVRESRLLHRLIY